MLVATVSCDEMLAWERYRCAGFGGCAPGPLIQGRIRLSNEARRWSDVKHIIHCFLFFFQLIMFVVNLSNIAIIIQVHYSAMLKKPFANQLSRILSASSNVSLWWIIGMENQKNRKKHMIGMYKSKDYKKPFDWNQEKRRNRIRGIDSLKIFQEIRALAKFLSKSV